MIEGLLKSNNGNGLGVKTLLLMQANNGFVDTANPSRTIQKSANPTIGSVQSKFNGLSFDCTTGGILIPASDKKDLVFPIAAKYTIEFWAYNTSLNNVWWIYSGQGSKSDLKVYNGNVYLQDEANSLNASSSFMTTGKWSHIAITSDGSNVKLFVDGKVIGTPFAPKGWSQSTYNLTFGSGEVLSYAYLDQIRVSNVARYTAAFTPPTDPFVVD